MTDHVCGVALHLLFEAPASKEFTHFQELHPMLFRMKLLFLKSQRQASH